MLISEDVPFTEGNDSNQTGGGDYLQISDSGSDSGLRFHTHGRFELSW